MTIEEFFAENNVTFKPETHDFTEGNSISREECLAVNMSISGYSVGIKPRPGRETEQQTSLCLDALMTIQEIAEMKMDQIRFIRSGKPPVTKLRIALNKLPFSIEAFDNHIGKYKILTESHIETNYANIPCGDREPTDEELADAYIRTQKKIIKDAQEDIDGIEKVMEEEKK